MKNPPKSKIRQSSAAPKTIPPFTVIKLWTKAGGRCELNGCNEYLLTDRLTLQEANLSNIAHIVARTMDGPRGNDPLPIAQRNNIENLMLLCTKCHKLVDDRGLVDQYPKELLLQYKKDHEDRILELTSAQPGNKTTMILCKANIEGEAVRIPNDHIRAAVHPRYPTDNKGIAIDLTSLPSPDDDAYYEMGTKIISEAMQSLYQPGIASGTIDHISVFALGPIPLLVYLGSRLSNKVETELYQRHRDTQQWVWKNDDETINYEVKQLRNGSDPKKVALILSLSGTVTAQELPDDINEEFTIYEITLSDIEPSRTYLNNRQALVEFQRTYQQFLASLRKNHGQLEELHLFPAIPAPVAVSCGKDLLLKIDPALVIYDKVQSGFNLALKVQKTA